jgi:hypothetical protein
VIVTASWRAVAQRDVEARARHVLVTNAVRKDVSIIEIEIANIEVASA